MIILQSVLKSVTDPPQPLHAGEVFVVWTLYVGVTEARVICQLLANHTSDKDLKETIEHFVDEIEEPILEKLKLFLAHEGIGIPPSTGDKPRANESQIPPGAKFSDTEIANLLAIKIEGILNTCHLGIAQSVRDDVGVMLMNMYQHVAVQGYTLKKLMQVRGWFRQPPLFQFSPELCQSK